ncbi:hypothetical protein [Magnetospirillum molischianum]|uniref:Uncharacterized protein n=1 Tax=Magnetospirillum molischianum DSM 120 TaxID=1150626 RepID=H8FUM7_MAGML|nr:hypothetical protein [Magnetospirillum molischianum]CCG42065.1 conserved hypothetical protein [Magnetospirillum molischianum DSM 120]
MPRSPSSPRSQAIRRINLTLEGPVAEVLAQMVPELKKLPRRGVLERVLDDPALLDRCLKAFRADPQRFSDLLVDRRNTPIEQADATLACGRTLDEVVAMVVRTCAKRQFRKRLDGVSRPLRKTDRTQDKAKNGLFERLSHLISPPPPPRRSRGEILYDSFKEHLRHDWQVALVSDYSTLSPQLVRRMGARILDYRIPEDIQKLRENPSNPPPPSTLPEPDLDILTGAVPLPTISPAPVPSSFPPPPIAAPAALGGDNRARIADILTADQKRLRPEAFTLILLTPEVRAALPHPEQTVRLTGQLAEVGGLPAKRLIGELGLRAEQLVVMMLVIHEILGPEVFRRSFGLSSNLDYVDKFIERAKADGINQGTPPTEIAAFCRRIFSSFRRS